MRRSLNWGNWRRLWVARRWLTSRAPSLWRILGRAVGRSGEMAWGVFQVLHTTAAIRIRVFLKCCRPLLIGRIFPLESDYWWDSGEARNFSRHLEELYRFVLLWFRMLRPLHRDFHMDTIPVDLSGLVMCGWVGVWSCVFIIMTRSTLIHIQRHSHHCWLQRILFCILEELCINSNNRN